MTTKTTLPVDQAPAVGQLIEHADAQWRVQHVEERATAYGVVAIWAGGHRPVGAEVDADVYALITVARPRSV